MSKRPNPTPKPDHVRSLRDLAANFVRAIDRTALEFEGAATADLSERVACLVALHDIEQTDAELAKTPTDVLRSRLNLIRQVARATHDTYGIRGMTNSGLKQRIEYLRQFAEVKGADDLEGFTDEALESLKETSTEIIKRRARIAKIAARRLPPVVVEEEVEEAA